MTSWESIALRWSVLDIIDENKYSGKVAPLPMTFQDLPSYYKAFQMPLLEESRAQFQRGLEELSTADYMTVTCKGEAKHRKRDDDEKELIKLDLGIVRLFQRGKKEDSSKPKPTDVVLLSTFLPKSLEDLRTKRPGEHYTLALISNSEDDFVASFQVKAWRSTTSPLLDCKKNVLHAIYVNSAATVRRIWDALNPDPTVFQDKRQHTIAKQNLYRDNQLVMECTTAGFEGPCDRKVNHLRGLVEHYCMSHQLNQPQISAISTTVMGLVKSDGIRTKLLQGPPGTGKTTVITVLLSIITALKERVLVSAPTNRAVAEIAERFLRTLEKKQSGLLSVIVDFVSPGGQVVRNVAPLHSGDVLLVGSEGRIDADGTLGDIYLNERVKLLEKAMARPSGWQASAREVLDILSTDSGLVQYQQYEQLCHKEGLPIPTFLEFIRQKMNSLGQNWIESGRVMCKHLPSKVLTPKARELLQLSCEIMADLLKCLQSNKGVKDKRVRRWFEDASKGHVTTNSPAPTPADIDFYSSKQKLLACMENRPGFDVLKLDVEATCRRNASLLFCTTAMAGSWRVKGSGRFDYAVVDEAAQLVEAETAIIAQMAGVNQMLLVGDPNQLQAMVTSKISKESGYSRSLFDRLQTLGHPHQILRIQYRMHPEISRFPNQQFYGGLLEDAPNVQHESYKIPHQNLVGPYAFINVTSGEETKNGKSFENAIECDLVEYILNIIQAGDTHLDFAENKKKLSVGVISPYRGQIEKISKRMADLASRGSKHSARLDVDFKTVDGFQGGEKDIVIFSAVRANSSGNTGFFDDFRRLNVAVTRARHCLWIIGHAPTLNYSNPLWRAVIADAKERRCYHDATVVPNFGTRIPLPLQIRRNEDDMVRDNAVVQKKLQILSLKEMKTVQNMKASKRLTKASKKLTGQASGKQVVLQEKRQTLTLKEVKSVQNITASTRLTGQALGKQILLQEKLQTLTLKEVKSVQNKKVNTRLPGQASGKQVVLQEKLQTLTLKEVKSVQNITASTRFTGQASSKQVILQEKLQTLTVNDVKSVQNMNVKTRLPGQASGEQALDQESLQNFFWREGYPDRQLQEGSRVRSNKQLPPPEMERTQIVSEDISRVKKAREEASNFPSNPDVYSWALTALMCIPVVFIVRSIFGRT